MNISFKFDGGPGELVDALGAVKALSFAIPSMKTSWNVSDELWPIIQKACFKTSRVTPENAHDATDLCVDLTPDMEATHTAELKFRKEAKEAIDEQIESLAKRLNTKASKIKKPEFYATFSSDKKMWDRLTGYLVAISDQGKGTELDDAYPAVSIAGLEAPYMPSGKYLNEVARKYMHGLRRLQFEFGKPFLLIDDVEMLDAHNIAPRAAKDWGCINVRGLSAVEKCALVSHKMCGAVYSKVGGLSHVAWAVGVPLILEYAETSENSHWATCRGDGSVTLDLSHENTNNTSVKLLLSEMYKDIYAIELED